tara:strand:- start:551 stop:1075 length:525 start_codon:yes stop_codon:yes gene_type:complete
MKYLSILTFISFFTLNSFSSDLELQSKEKQAGDVLSSSEWNTLLGKLKSSNRKITQEMIIGNWTCSAQALTGYSTTPGWVVEENPPFTFYKRLNYPLTFSAGSPGTWTSTEDNFFNNGSIPTNGYFKIINNTLYLSYSGAIQRSFNLKFHGKNRFSAKKSGEYPGPLHNFYCDK